MIGQTWKAEEKHYAILDRFVEDVSANRCENFKMRGDVDDGLARIRYKGDKVLASEDDDILVAVYLEGGRWIKGISLVADSPKYYNECVGALEEQLGLNIRNKLEDCTATVSL